MRADGVEPHLIGAMMGHADSRRAAAKMGARARWGRGHLPSPADVEQIRTLGAAGQSLRAISKATGVPKSTVGRVLAG